MKLSIPNYNDIEINNLVLDYNGTIAYNGTLLTEVKELFPKLLKYFNLYVITADTFGSVKEELKDFNINIVVLKSDNHTQEKADFVKNLQNTLAIGNGNNDAQMLKEATLSIAIVGKEGCATKTLLNSQIVCHSIKDALELPLNPKQLVATLRR